MTSYMSSYQAYIGITVLSGIGFLPLAILWFISFCVARRRHDPARVGVTWMKVTFPLWVLALLFATIHGGLLVWTWYGDYSTVSTSFLRNLSRAMGHLAATGNFLIYLADICLFITFVQLANGFMLCLQGPGEPSKMRKFSRIAIFAWGFVLFAIALGSFGASNAWHVRYAEVVELPNSAYITEREKLNREAANINRVTSALMILFWITAIPIVVHASFVMHKAKHHGILKSGASILLAAAVLNFVRLLATMAIDAHTTLVAVSPVNFGAVWIVSAFFNYIFMMVVLILLFSLAARKRHGLWSQPPPEWNYPAVVYLGPDGQPMQGAPVPVQGGPPMMQQGGAPMQQPQYQQHQQHQQFPQQQQYQQQPMQQQQQQQDVPAYLQFAEQQKQQQQQV